MHSIAIATKGILGGILPTKGFILISIEEILLIRTRLGLDSSGGLTERKIKKIRIKFWYNGKEYIDEKIIRNNLKVNNNNIKIEFINNKPKIKLNFKE